MEDVKYYMVGNPNSSPYEPMISDIVIYQTQRQGLGEPECLPAIVVKAYDDDSVDLVVFSTIGNRHVMRVRFSSEQTAEHTWHWPSEKKARPIMGVDLAGETFDTSESVEPVDTELEKQEA